MKHSVYGIFITLLAPLLIVDTAFAQARPSIQLTPAQTQQFSHDLVRSDSQDFFRQGQEQLEKEIGILTQRKLFLREGVLKISRDLQIQQNPTQFERPNNLAPLR